jgi:hypothetical protein
MAESVMRKNLEYCTLKSYENNIIFFMTKLLKDKEEHIRKNILVYSFLVTFYNLNFISEAEKDTYEEFNLWEYVNIEDISFILLCKNNEDILLYSAGRSKEELEEFNIFLV